MVCSQSLDEAEPVSRRRHEAPSSGNEAALVPVVSPCISTQIMLVPLVSTEVSPTKKMYHLSATASKKNWWQAVMDDFDTTKGGDFKILRAIGRTATVNAAVAVAAATGGVATGLVGFVTGGAITAKRLGEGLEQEDAKEVTKSSAGAAA